VNFVLLAFFSLAVGTSRATGEGIFAAWFCGRGRLQPDFLHLRGPLPVMGMSGAAGCRGEPVAQIKMIAFEDTIWYR
jgi:hypothetical protein